MSLQASENSQMKAVLLDLESIDHQDIDSRCLTELDISWEFYRLTSPADVSERIRHADIIVTNKVVIDRSLMQQAENLKLICVAATGTNNVDLDAAREMGIAVCNVTGYATASVVQYVFATLLSLNARLTEYQQAVKQGRWSKSHFFCLLDYSFNELAGKTLGIVGYGELGRAVADVARAMGMNILIAQRDASDHREGRLALHDMLPQIDVLSLHCPLTEQTRNLIAKPQLDLLRKNAIVINSARGGIVNEADLLASLKAGNIAGAVTDVLTTEPPPEDHILLQDDLPNLIVTPHIAWASVESRQRLLEQVADNIKSFLKGQLRNNVL